MVKDEFGDKLTQKYSFLCHFIEKNDEIGDFLYESVGFFPEK